MRARVCVTFGRCWKVQLWKLRSGGRGFARAHAPQARGASLMRGVRGWCGEADAAGVQAGHARCISVEAEALRGKQQPCLECGEGKARVGRHSTRARKVRLHAWSDVHFTRKAGLCQMQRCVTRHHHGVPLYMHPRLYSAEWLSAQSTILTGLDKAAVDTRAKGGAKKWKGSC